MQGNAMTSRKNQANAKGGSHDAKKQRLSTALRENLKRRKVAPRPKKDVKS